MTMLERIRKPGDIKKLKKKEYNRLAQEIRNFLIEKISVTGGHLASNLGVVSGRGREQPDVGINKKERR